MWDKSKTISFVNSHAESRSHGKCAAYVRIATEAGGVNIKIPPPRIGSSASACDYGPSFVAVGFKPVFTYAGAGPVDTSVIPGQQPGDVVVIQPIDGHPHGHIAIFNGSNWVSDFVQEVGFYPGLSYRNAKPSFVMYRYAATENLTTATKTAKPGNIKIVWPVPSNVRGSEFSSPDDVMSHLEGEASGWYMVGSNGMWHGGIHITSTTTPWCALSGKAASELLDFPVPFKGEQSVRCMADGEVVAYRICRDYLTVPWETGPLSVSGSFVLVRHYIQPGEEKENGLHFYTLYMHLAPYSAYASSENETQWIVNDNLSAYRPEWLLSASTDNKSVSDSYRAATIPKGAHVEWDASDSSLHTIGNNDRRYGLVTYRGLSDKAKGNGIKTSPEEGQQYWILTDKNNLVPAGGEAACPSWWTHLLPPYAEPMQFDTVVCPTPYPISAGDSIGHLGFFQVPKDGGYDSRYQVHIECLSADDSLPAFLTNPEKVGESTPLYLKCPKGLPLFSKDLKTKTMTRNGRITQGEAILKLSQVKTEKDAHKQEYWFLPYVNGYVPKSNTSVETLSQYDLGKLGFTTIVDEALSFDHLDGTTPSKGLVRSILDLLLNVSKLDTRLTHRAVPHNYQRLLNRIDSSVSPYSSQEYLSAIHNPSYRDVKNKMIVKHPSEWYHKKETSIWQSFLNKLTNDAPEWREYCEDYLDKMVWMQDASKLKLGSSLWHMHPVEFLGTFANSEEMITYEQLKAMLPADKENEVKVYLEPLNETMKLFEINTPLRKAHFMAQILHETGFFKYTEETASGNAYEGRSDLGNNQAGDGPLFKGRGLLQITGRDNYVKCQQYLRTKLNNDSFDITSTKHKASQLSTSPRYATLASGYFWRYIKPKLNDSADNDDVYWVSVYVNGWAVQKKPYYPSKAKEPNHMNDRVEKLSIAKKAFGLE